MDGTIAPAATPLYADRQKVYPRAVAGRLRRIKWAVLIACLGLYYLVPWLRWDRGPGLPDQAVLADIANARLFFFFIELWPQEVYFLTGLLILGAFALFLVSSLYGRVWCGFACPQTVWTDLFMWVERRIQGDRAERMRLDQAPWDARKLRLKAATHAAWLLIAAATGGAFVTYFNDAPTVIAALLTGQASATTYFFFALFTATTWLLGGVAREQVCTYMCPWPRFQAAMLDEHSLVVSYRTWRGEPRGKAPKGVAPRGVGDCVECFACVHACPTGIDIRDGLQLECIGCGLCVDACDAIMRRLDRPQGLIAFDSISNLDASGAAVLAMPAGSVRHAPGMAARLPRRWLRPRTMIYAGCLAVVAAAMLGALLLRQTVTLTALRDRAPLYVALADGGVRNGYTLKLANRGRTALSLALAVDGPPGLRVAVPDSATASDAAGRPLFAAPRDGVAEVRVLLSLPGGIAAPAQVPVSFRLLDPAGRTVAREHSSFVGPGR
jgi:cytochrome c oxidase accessory protein FixG